MTVKSEIYDWLQCIVVALVTSILIFVFIGRVTGILGPSMEKTLYNNDRVVISNLFYTPKQGDIIIWTKESFRSVPIVKRVIATENQTVNMDFKTGQVWVDGVLLKETYIKEQMWRNYDVTFPVTVPEGCLFVMGDNRNVSQDSRSSEVGMVDERCILGKVYYLISPLDRFGKVS